MKIKTTKKQIKQNSNKILKVGYCSMQNLLRFKEPFAYSSGAYGWACDYYDLGGVIISTGYNPIGKDIDYKLVRKYENEASSIGYHLDFEVRKELTNNLLNEFLQEV